MGVHTISKDIFPKGNAIEGLEFELDYYNVAVRHFSHYATKNLLNKKKFNSVFIYLQGQFFKQSLIGLNSEFSFS